jgi:predicted Fe-Mo cluster-binding NifX family protein
VVSRFPTAGGENFGTPHAREFVFIERGALMKLAVTSQGGGLQSPIDPRFGRARYLIVVDTETGAFSAVDNSVNLNAAQGAGIQAAKRIVELGVGALITGHVGPKAFSALQAGGMKIYAGASGTVAEAVAQFKAGKLAAATSPDVEGHWS